MKDAKIKRLFIVGAPRSGTTWLQILFAQHPNVSTCSETHIYTQYLNLLYGRWAHEYQRAARGFKVSGLTQIVDRKAFDKATKAFASNIYDSALGSESAEATVYLDKTPENLLHHREILTHFPDAYFIHIVRDPRAVSASFKSAASTWWTWTQSGAISVAQRWKKDVNKSKEIAESTNKYIEIRYEDLAGMGGALYLQQLFEFIHEPLSTEKCEDIYASCSIENIKEGNQEGLTQPWDFSNEPSNFFRKGAVDSWSNELSDYSIYSTELITKQDLINFGYTCVNQHNIKVKAQFAIATICIAVIKLVSSLIRRIEWRIKSWENKL
ncbi:MAG: hypothetical protein ACI9CO_000228 [Candidatus Azotimanducaceae bacterium]|jgi:hypothetical protein